jgi:hypothetical protein
MYGSGQQIINPPPSKFSCVMHTADQHALLRAKALLIHFQGKQPWVNERSRKGKE